MERMSLEDFGEARLLMAADAGYKLTAEEVEQDTKERTIMTKGLINGVPCEVYSGSTVAEVLKRGVSPSSIADIHDELEKLGLDFKDYGDEIPGYQWFEMNGKLYLIEAPEETEKLPVNLDTPHQGEKGKEAGNHAAHDADADKTDAAYGVDLKIVSIATD